MRSILCALLLLFCVVSARALYIGGEFDNIEALYNSGQLADAKTQLTAYLSQHPDHAAGHYYMGRIHFEQHDYKAAEKSLKRAVALAPDSANYYVWLGQTYGMLIQRVGLFKKFGTAKKIKKSFLRAVELDAHNVYARLGLINYYLNAPGIVGGDARKAESQARILMKLDDARGRLALARAHEKEKKTELALKEYAEFERAYGDSADFAGFYNSYGYFLLNQERPAEAVEKFEAQVALSPGSANAYDSLGDGYAAAGRLDEAAGAYRRALELDPQFAHSIKNLKKIEDKLRSRAAK